MDLRLVGMIAALIAAAAPCQARPGSSTFDAQGNLYLVGERIAAGDITTANAFQPTFKSTVCGSFGPPVTGPPIPCNHGYIRKISADGTKLLAATYLEGSASDVIEDVAVDAAGNIYVIGSTTSPDFPITPGAFQTSTPGPATGFLAVLSPDCSKLLYSTYVSFASPSTILLDSSGRVILAGINGPGPLMTTVPVTTNNDPNQNDAVVVRFDVALSKLEIAIQVGGTLDETVGSATLDSAGNVYITGFTSSTPHNSGVYSVQPYTLFPVTPGAVNELNGVASVYVMKIAPSGQVIYAAAFGGSGADAGQTIDVDGAGNVYLTGRTGSTDFPLTPGAFRTGYSQGFAAVLSPDGSQLLYSAYLGTSAPAFAALDSSANLLMVGMHSSYYANFPSSPDSAQPCIDREEAESGGPDYLLELDPLGSRPSYGTVIPGVYLGGPTPIFGLSALSQVFLEATADLVSIYNGAARPPQGVTCVANAATYRSGAIAPGEIVTLFGPSIGAAQGVQVSVNGFAAPVLYSGTNQINAVVPFEVAGQQQVSIQVTNNGTNLPPVTVPLVDAAPGIFTLDGSGGGQAAAINQDGTINSYLHPAAPGSIVSLYITGAGMMQPTPQDGSLGTGQTSTVLSPSVQLSGSLSPLTVLYSGDAPGEVQGLVQLNVQLPAQIYQTGYIVLNVNFGSGSSLVTPQAFVWLDIN